MKYTDIEEIRLKRREQFKSDRNNPQQLPLIVEEINARIKFGKINIFEIGKLLTQAKRFVKHSEFKKFVKENFPEFGYSTANNYMRVYKYCLKRPQLAVTIPASVLYIIASPQFPKDLREYLFNKGKHFKHISREKIRNIMKRYQKKEIDLKSPEIENLIQFYKDKKRWSRDERQIEKNRELLKLLQEKVNHIAEQVDWPVNSEQETSMTDEKSAEVEAILHGIDEAIASMKPKNVVKRKKPARKAA